MLLFSQTRHNNNHFSREFYDNISSETDDTGNRYFLSPVQSILVGVPVGCLLGIIVGTRVGPNSPDQLLNGIRGAAMGMSIMPFIQYEMQRKAKGIDNSLNRWAIVFGGNMTFTDYDGTEIRKGFSAGLERYYFINENSDLMVDLTYTHHRFRIPDKIIIYSSYTVENNDINFSAHYLDIALFVIHKFKTRKFSIHLGIGPFLSTQFLDKTTYRTNWEEPVNYYNKPAYKYDYSYNDDEVVGILPYFGWSVNLGFTFDKLIFQFNYKHSLRESNHIYGISPETKLNSIEFAVGLYGN